MFHTKWFINSLFVLITVGALSACTSPTVPSKTAQKTVSPPINVKAQSEAVINANKQLNAMFSQSSALPEAKAELVTYKKHRKVGEKLNGFLAAMNPRKKTQQLVKLINQARLKQFQQIARDNNFSVQEVEALAGPISIQNASKGHYIQQNGQWIKK